MNIGSEKHWNGMKWKADLLMQKPFLLSHSNNSFERAPPAA